MVAVVVGDLSWRRAGSWATSAVFGAGTAFACAVVVSSVWERCVFLSARSAWASSLPAFLLKRCCSLSAGASPSSSSKRSASARKASLSFGSARTACSGSVWPRAPSALSVAVRTVGSRSRSSAAASAPELRSTLQSARFFAAAARAAGSAGGKRSIMKAATSAAPQDRPETMGAACGAGAKVCVGGVPAFEAGADSRPSTSTTRAFSPRRKSLNLCSPTCQNTSRANVPLRSHAIFDSLSRLENHGGSCVTTCAWRLPTKAWI